MVFVAASSRNVIKTQEQNNGNKNPVLYGSLILTAAVFPLSFCCLAFSFFVCLVCFYFRTIDIESFVGLSGKPECQDHLLNVLKTYFNDVLSKYRKTLINLRYLNPTLKRRFL